MEYRNLGQTGLKVSALCLGTMHLGWTADEHTSLQVLTRAAEQGVNFIDCVISTLTFSAAVDEFVTGDKKLARLYRSLKKPRSR